MLSDSLYLSGNIKRSAMIRGGTDKRQPGGNIHPVIESQQLQRNMPRS